jgi:hypothetical protein
MKDDKDSNFSGVSDELFEALCNLMISSSTKPSPFPPTLIFNEGWLLRLILDWYASKSSSGMLLHFEEGARWYSEALLPSAFLPRYRGDRLGESRTHADGVIGHFEVGIEGKADFELSSRASQFLVLEAKVSSGLSSGVTHASYFDQAARNIACMAEVLRRAQCHPDAVDDLGFYVLAPASQIDKGVFSSLIKRESVLQKVERRVSEYQGEKDAWIDQWFHPTLNNTVIRCLSWEELIAAISSVDRASYEGLLHFYDHCLRFN